jgi:hypothetical protein
VILQDLGLEVLVLLPAKEFVYDVDTGAYLEQCVRNGDDVAIED